MLRNPAYVLVLMLAAGALTVAAAQARADETFIEIGAGGVTGVYYPAGGAICRLVNKGRKEHGIRCTVEATGGSVDNVNALRGGDLEMGIAQSDVQYEAFRGEGEEFVPHGPFEGLRAVFALHPEPFTVVARTGSRIATFDDLRGKRVNIGNPGSGQRATMDALLAAKGWTKDDFSRASELRTSAQAQALANGEIDAIAFTVGHPSGAVQEATTTTDARLLPVAGSEVDQLVAGTPYYAKATIPGGIYRGTDRDTETFGVRATLVTSAEVPEEVVYQVVKAVFDNFDSFKKLHPAFARLDKAEMVRASLSAPLHPGAERYFRETGMM